MPTIAVRPSFLNLDLELRSKVSLTPLAKHLAKTNFVLFNGREENHFNLCAEPAIKGKLNANARMCTEHFLLAVEGLPEKLVALFGQCTSRVFDFGFEGGVESNPISVTISKSHLARMARLGIAFRVTVYSHRSTSGA